MFDIPQLAVIIPAMPLVAAIITAILGPRLLREKSHWPAVACMGVSLALSIVLFFQVGAAAGRAESAAGGQPHAGYERTVVLWNWAELPDARAAQQPDVDGAATVAPPGGSFRVDVTLRADPLTSIMLVMVTFVSLLVVIYASGYMHGDRGYWRFFTYVSLFVFSMTMLVSSSNFLLLYVFWEAVGVCSYLLIGFWYEKPEAAVAGKKAFLVNRIGDFGFALGVFLIWVAYGTFEFSDSASVTGVLGRARVSGAAPFAGGWLAVAIPLLLFVGACGKSAQFPLHVWLPDAMEGPTPVSALIHAATMVTAGVYMVTRCLPLFLAAPDALVVVAIIGGVTALMAAIIAVTQNDLKRVLAYSTVSQLGYMFVGLGTASLAGAAAGMFHLFTHAFFKALLFLGAGSVMHAMGNVIDMRRFSGLRRLMPWTHATFWCGALALAGVVPFAGFWSKDAILAAVHDRGAHSAVFSLLNAAAVVTALLTAFYTFRALFSTFFGPLRVPTEAGHHAHESPRSITVPLAILAAGALVVGMAGEWGHSFADYLGRTPSLVYAAAQSGHESHAGFHWDVAMLSTAVALLGVGLAAYFYLGERRQIDALARFMQSRWGLRLYQLSSGKFYWDQIYNVLFVAPLKLLAAVSYALDRGLIDRLVDFVGAAPKSLGSAFRALQTGLVQFYALAMVLGVLILVGALLLWPIY